MKNLLILLLFLTPVIGKSQYVKIPTNYDAKKTAEHIMMGHIKMFLNDSITEVVVEKSNGRWVTSYLNKSQVEKIVWKTLKKGKSHFTGKTNGGYRFYITIEDVNDDTKILGSLDITMDAFTQQIKFVEIKKG